jgi:hypothetical protein
MTRPQGALGSLFVLVDHSSTPFTSPVSLYLRFSFALFNSTQSHAQLSSLPSTTLIQIY